MGNMTYCRFENTSSDFQDCLEALRNREPISISEFRALTQMVNDARDFLIEVEDLGFTEEGDAPTYQELCGYLLGTGNDYEDDEE